MNKLEKAKTGEGNAPREDKGRITPQQFRHHEYALDIRSLTRGQLQESYVELKAQRDELLAALKAIGQALPKDPQRDKFGRTIRVHTDWSLTEPLRHLAINYDIGGSFDIQEQAGQVARAAIARAEGRVQ